VDVTAQLAITLTLAVIIGTWVAVQIVREA
jgi:hypothetical protein